MTIQRIDNEAKRMHGYQARVHKPGGGRATRWFSDASYGGRRKARQLARQAEADLQRQVHGR